MDTLDETLSCLITTFHILHQHQILDEQGHISVRHPRVPTIFFTSNVPPNLVSSKNDLNQWNVVDGSPLTNLYSGYQAVQNVPEFSEYYSHSCMYAFYRGVQKQGHDVRMTAYANRRAHETGILHAWECGYAAEPFAKSQMCDGS